MINIQKLLFLCMHIVLTSLYLACASTQEQADTQKVQEPGFYVDENNIGPSPDNNNSNKQEDYGEQGNNYENEGNQGNYDNEGNQGNYDSEGNQSNYDNEGNQKNSNEYSNDSTSNYDEENNLFENSTGNQFSYNEEYEDGDEQQENQQNPNEQLPTENQENYTNEYSKEEQSEQVDELNNEEISGNLLWWLGLDFREKESTVKLEMVTIGKPIYKFSQNQNPSGQPELIIKFLDTKMRRKLKRPIDASEFLSPVAYIRTRYHGEDNSTDVIITLRDAIKPELFSHDGNILLSFKIPDRYFGNSEVGQTPSGKVEVLGDSDITPVLLAGSVGPDQDGFQPSDPATEMNENSQNYGENNQSSNESDFDEYNDSDQDVNLFQNNNNSNNFDNKQKNSKGNNSNNSYENQNSEKINNERNSNEEDQYEENDNNAEHVPHTNDLEIKSISLFAVAQDDFENNYTDNNYYGDEPINSQSGQSGEKNVFNDSEGNQFDNGLFQDNETNEINTSNLDNNSDNLFNEQNVEANSYDNYDNVDLSGEETEGRDAAIESNSQALQPISMNFKGATLKEVIRTFTTENGVNFIFPEDVGAEKVYLSFTNVPWDQALQAVLETHSLGISKLDGDVIRIDRLTTLDKEKKELEKARESASRLIPTKVLIVRLSYATAKDVVKVVTTMLESYKHDKRTRVEADNRTNSVIVEAIPTALSKIKALINRVDLQTPQVKIDTRIVEVLKNDTLQLGINWAMPLRTDQSRGLGLGNLPFPNQMYSAFSVDTGIEPANLSGRSAIDFHFGSINNLFELDVRLRMAEQQNQLRSIQNNSVVVLDNEKAETKVGQVIYTPIPIGAGEDRLVDVEYALKLTVTPHITADGAVQMDIEVENSSAIQGQAKPIPDKNTRVVKTKLLRENGETAVIGGVYTTDYTQEIVGVPFFSKIPILGVFFRSKSKQEAKRELIIMVTPTVINSAKSLSESSSNNGNFASDGNGYGNSSSNYEANNSYGSSNNADSGNYYNNQGTEGQSEDYGNANNAESNEQYQNDNSNQEESQGNQEAEYGEQGEQQYQDQGEQQSEGQTESQGDNYY
ncbi:MAG: secretin N-terminal domain-containing protein [Oligoflexales bacterium]